MRRFPVNILAVAFAWLMGSIPVLGQATPIGPFTGTVTEGFNIASPLPSYQQLPVFNGFGLIKNTFAGGALKVEFSSSINGDTVVPRSPPTFGGQIGISDWTFTTPLAKYGGYWENNSRFDDANISFYDVNNVLIDTQPVFIPKAGQTWVWNGWSFATPVSRFVVTGNDEGFFFGFIWYEDHTLTFAAAVPEASTWMLIGIIILGACGVVAWRSWHRRQESELMMDESHLALPS